MGELLMLLLGSFVVVAVGALVWELLKPRF
jgi:hypothetical protein